MYDIIIFGIGPTGITAGVYPARKKLKILVLAEFAGGRAAGQGCISSLSAFRNTYQKRHELKLIKRRENENL